QHRLASLHDIGKSRLSYVVQQGNAGVKQHARPPIGIAARNAWRGVDDGGYLAVYQRAGGGGIQVGMMDEGDVAGSQALRQVFGAPVLQNPVRLRSRHAGLSPTTGLRTGFSMVVTAAIMPGFAATSQRQSGPHSSGASGHSNCR